MPEYGRIACVYCSHQFRVSMQHVGEAVECPGCGQFTPFEALSILDTFEERVPAQQTETPREETTGPQLLDWHEKDVILGLYEVRQKLGEGGMGKVYLVHHRGWGMDVAVKVPKPAAFGRAVAVENFERECRTWANLGLHPHTVSCYFVRRFGEIPLVFVEYVDGQSLAYWIQSKWLYQGNPRQALARILDIAIQMAWGLHHAHQHGMVHRDVKPANVMMTRRGDAKITDFGLARARSLAGERHPGVAGQGILVSSGVMTRAYCSPEQARGQMRLTIKTDIWSWAVAVLEMFVGGVSWMAGEMAGGALDAHLADPPEDPRLPRVPASVATLLRTCFNVDPEARPATMLDVAAALKQVFHQVTGAAYGRREADATAMAQEEMQAANLNNRAVSMIELGQYHEAPQLLKQAASTAKLQEVMYNYSLFALRHRSGAKVREMIRYIPSEPNPTRHAYYAGMLLLEAGELYDAIDVLGEALEGDETLLADVLNARGIGLLLVGETQPAIASFEAALARAPDRLNVLRNLALAYYYDRQLGVAVDLFEKLASQLVLDADDAIRYATVLSAVGLMDEACQELDRALASPGKSSVVLLTASELLHGSQTFLPGVMPLREGSRDHQQWVRRVVADEPQNLRAHIDAATLPTRYGLKPEALSRKQEEVFLTWDYVRIGGAIMATYLALTKRFRWGDIGDTLKFVRLALLSGLPAFVLLVPITFLVFPARPLLYVLALILPVAYSLAKATPAARLGRAAAGLMLTVCIAFFLLYLVLTPTPNTTEDPRYFSELLFLFRGGAPSWIDTPPALSPVSLGDMTSDFANWGRETLGLQKLPRFPLLSLILFVVLPAGILFIVWQFMLQAMTCHARAWPPSSESSSSSLSRLAQALTHRIRQGKGRVSSRDSSHHEEQAQHTAAARIERLKISALMFRRKRLGNLGLSMALLLPLATVFADEMGYRTGSSMFVWLAPVAFLVFLWVAFSARLFLPACAAITLVIVAPPVFSTLGSTATASGLGQFTVVFVKGVVVPIGVLICSALTIWYSPEFKTEWRSFDPKSLDIRQIVDPLNIRSFAAPWQLVQMKSTRHSRADAPGINTGSAALDSGRAHGPSE